MDGMSLLNAMAQRMRWQQQRQDLLAQNVANADTPNYRGQELKPTEFGDEVHAVSSPRVVLAATSPMHIAGPASDGGGDPEVQANFEVRTVAEFLIKQTELADRVREIGAPLITPDEKLSALAQSAGVRMQRIQAPGPEIAARLAFAQLDRGATVRADDLDANYIRRSDAEIFSATLL